MTDHRDFLAAVAAARLQDPHGTFENLSAFTGASVDDLEHYALVKFATAGSEAILACGPDPLQDLLDARRAEDGDRVAGIIDWIAAGR